MSMQFSLDQLHWQGEDKKNLVLPGMWDLSRCCGWMVDLEVT